MAYRKLEYRIGTVILATGTVHYTTKTFNRTMAKLWAEYMDKASGNRYISWIEFVGYGQ